MPRIVPQSEAFSQLPVVSVLSEQQVIDGGDQ